MAGGVRITFAMSEAPYDRLQGLCVDPGQEGLHGRARLVRPVPHRIVYLPPHHADGNFCKHLVATGLAAIDTGRIPVDETASSTVEAAVQAMDVGELRELVMTLAQRDDGVRRMLEVRATAVSGDDSQAKAELGDHARNALAFRGFVDYRRSFEVAEAASHLLDELEIHLNSGSAELVRPALLYALTRLRKIVGNVDDSSGSIGDQCQRAAGLYAQACLLGQPDPVELAKWLVKFRADSPGWPHVELADFVDSFDEQALATYRRAVAALDRKLADRNHWQRFEVDAMLLELADHDGDVDRAVELLSQREEHAQYGAIIDRLRAAGRPEEAVAWIDRAVAEGRISSHNGGNEYWLSPPDDVAATYQELGRIDDALGVLRADFVRRPSVSTYRVLLDFAARIDRADTERSWAFDHARQLAASDRFALGAVLVQLCLSEGDVDSAWQAAERFWPPAGPGRNSPSAAPMLGRWKPQTSTARSSRVTSGTPPIASSIPILPRRWRRWQSCMNAAVAAPISRRSSPRFARSTVGDRRL